MFEEKKKRSNYVDNFNASIIFKTVRTINKVLVTALLIRLLLKISSLKFWPIKKNF